MRLLEGGRAGFELRCLCLHILSGAPESAKWSSRHYPVQVAPPVTPGYLGQITAVLSSTVAMTHSKHLRPGVEKHSH